MNWFRGTTNRIFLDYASATPVLPEVKQVMESYWADHFENPSAIYQEGVRVKVAMEKNRTKVARILEVAPENIVFTSSGTESDNLAVLGAFEAFLEQVPNRKPHIIISSIEHPAVRMAAEEVVRRGGEMSVVEVDEEGLVSPEDVRKLIKRNTFLVSIGLANSEIGTVEPVAKIGRLVRKYRKELNSNFPYFHTDASQAVTSLSVSPESLQADLVTLDGSKIYGPKGVGVLVVRTAVEVHPIIFGGGQERGRRSGTQNPALISGFARAFEIVSKDREKESKRLEVLREEFIKILVKRAPKATVNGSKEFHLPNIVSISVPGVLAELLVLKLDKLGVMASVGTACSYDERVSGSPIIRAIGKSELSESTIRFSFGRNTNLNEIKRASEIFCREISNMLK